MNQDHLHGEPFAPLKEFMELDEWRARTLTRVLRVVLLLGIIGSIPYTYFAATHGVTAATFVKLGGVAMVGIASMRNRLPYQLRAFCLVMVPYIGGTAALFMQGTLTLLYFVAFALTAVIFMGSRAAIGAIVLATLTLFVGGQFATWEPMLAGIQSNHSIFKWGLLAFNYACIASTLTLACAILLRKVEYSLKTQKLAAHSVELRQQEISRLKRELEAMKHWTNDSTPTEIAAKDFANPFV